MIVNGTDISIRELHILIAGCLKKDRSSQRKIYEVYGSRMMTLCLRYSKNREEAEEVMHDGFLQMYRCIGQFKNIGSFEGWLRRIMINCALQRYRGKSIQDHEVSLTEDHYLLVGEFNSDIGLNEKEMIRMIQALPPACRMVFNLYVFEGMKHREIATLLNVTEGTSKSNLYDARSILMKQLSAELKIAR
ncbi:MAG TPA: RNA polymerase sigma factor [Puia sp.]|jgi:RNA polymerase sigma factor (sigma-70 family)|nr:RNA polymerase sigma factor [Puia sp.]